MDMTVITQLYCQLYITCQLHVSANTIFDRHQVGYNCRRKLHSIYNMILLTPTLMVILYHIIYCAFFSDNFIQPDDGQK